MAKIIITLTEEADTTKVGLRCSCDAEMSEGDSALIRKIATALAGGLVYPVNKIIITTIENSKKEGKNNVH